MLFVRSTVKAGNNIKSGSLGGESVKALENHLGGSLSRLAVLASKGIRLYIEATKLSSGIAGMAPIPSNA